MSDPLTVLVAGLGSIGQRHARNLRRLAGVRIVAYRRRGLPLPDDLRGDWLLETDDLDRALAERPDAALVCSPPRFQAAVARRAVAAGCPLFIEKPISDSLEEARELEAEARARRLPTLVGFNLRFHPQVERLRALAAGMEPLRVVRAHVGQYLPDWHPDEDYRLGYSARRELGGGVILDLIHELDLARALGGEVSAVSCFAGRLGPLEITTEDAAEINLRFAGGALGNVHLDYLQRALQRGCHLIGDGGTVVWDFAANELRSFEAGDGVWRVDRLEGFDRNEMYLAEMAHFLECVRDAATPLVNLADGVRTLEVAMAARESAEAGGKVVELG